MADNFGRDIHVFEVGPSTHLTDHTRVEVHAVNRASAERTMNTFFSKWEEYQVKLSDAPDWCISLPELGIIHDPASHLTVGAGA